MDIVTPSPEQPLEFTGERYTSAASGEIKHEHYHRYFFALQFCYKKIVVDIASGEGYGSSLLGMVAQRVLGVEIDSAAVKHASGNYRNDRVSFVNGDCRDIPALDASADVVVSFETLEHIAEQDRFFSEIKRVLRPGGILVISTPNVGAYKLVATEPNPFHVKELDTAEFRAILSRSFANYRLFGQRSIVGSAITPDPPDLSEADRQQTFRAVDDHAFSVQPGIGPPTYFIAVASDTVLPEIHHGLLDDRPFLMNLYGLLQKHAVGILELEHQLRAAATIQNGLEHQLQNRESEVIELHQQANRMEEELRLRDEELAELRLAKAELIELHGQANRMVEELRLRDEELAKLRVAKAELTELHGQANRTVEELRSRMVEELRLRDDELAKLRLAKAELIELHGQANRMEEELRSRDEELAQMRTLVAGIYKSGSWRLTRPMRFFRDAVRALKDRTVRLLRWLELSRISGRSVLGHRMNSVVSSEQPPAQPGSTARSNGAPASAVSAESESEQHLLARSGLFDEQFYCETNPDLAVAEISPLEHFLKLGAFEGRRPNPLFDTAYYLTTNPDVAKAGVNPVIHYLSYGALEGRDPSPDFETSFYLESNPDVAASKINPLVHFLRHGAQEGRLPLPQVESESEQHLLARSGLFDEQFYCETNPDLAAAEISPLEHFLKLGAFEGRRPNPLFDTAYYLTTNPDVAKAGVNPVIHYLSYGALEGRDPSPDFDTSFYLESNPDVAASKINPLVHFLRYGAQEGRLALPQAESERELHLLARSGLFDEQFYCETNPDLAAAKISPLEHFLKLGTFEGRRPNPLFDTAYYLATNPDVAKARVNPVIHYLCSGALEGRDPSPDFDTSFYLESNPDVAASKINPLVHFLRHGAQEGRLPLPQENSVRLQKLARIASARRGQQKLEYRPLLSVLMPTYNTQPIYLEAAVRSVMAQAYPNWELRIVDDGSSNASTFDSLGRIASWDKRIFVVRNAQHHGISGATNDALRDACGEYIAMLDHDDELTVDALYEVVLALNADQAIDVVYTDQDYISPNGESVGHLFKPDWSPTLFRGVMYVGHLLTVRRSVALEIGGFDSAFDLVQDFEFMLRLSERTRKICHVPKVLYSWRRIPESVAGGGKVDGGIERLQAAAVQAHLERLRLGGCARPNPRHPHRVLIEPPMELPRNIDFDLFVHGKAVSKPGVAAVENALARMAHRVRRVNLPASWSEVEIDGKATANLCFSAAAQSLSDAGVLSKFLVESTAEFLVVMSAEIAIETADWLESLVWAAQEGDVVAVCPAVLSADGLIAHAGFIVGGDGRVRPAMRCLEPETDGYAGSLSCAREISAASADLLVLRRSALVSLFRQNLVYVTPDFLVIDLTLQATRSGLRAVCIPYVRARRLATTDFDEDHLLDGLLHEDIWAGNGAGDPFYNPNFVVTSADYT